MSIKKTLKIIGIVFALFFLGVIVLLVVDISNDEQTEETKKPLTVEEQIKNEINKELGEKTNNKKDRIVSLRIEESGYVEIVLNSDDSLSTKSTKDSMLYDATDAFPILFKDKSIQRARIIFISTLVDVYGKESDEEVIRITLTRETNDKITWDNFNIDNFGTVAENFFVHPALQK